MSSSSPLARVAAVLQGLPITFVHARFGPAAIHVVGRAAGPLAGLNVYVHEDDLDLFSHELPFHMAAPPVWSAWLGVCAPLPLEWTWGYLKARKQLVPHGGVFLPREQLKPACAHPAPDVEAARLHGMLSYLLHIPLQDAEPVLTPNAAD